MPTCPRCDALVGDEDRYCLNCGRALVEGVARTAPTSTVTQPAPPPDPEPAEVAGPAELVACPRCGASNSARRRRCGRCGEHLRRAAAIEPVPVPRPQPGEGREAPPTPGPDEPSAAPVPAPAAWRRRTIAIAVVGLGAILGTVLGIAAATGMGPFATVEQVPFDPAAYPDGPRELAPVTAGSSSTAPGDGAREFGPELTVDGDLTTAWAPEGDADGALLRHGFVSPVWVSRLEIATGDQHDQVTFETSGRVTRAMVDLGSQRLDVIIDDTEGVQVVQLPEPVLTDEVTWEVTGTSGEGAAITEVRYAGWPADDSDRAAHRERQ